MPSCHGGGKQLTTFLSETVGYPKIAIRMGMEARVLVKFVVEKESSVVDVKVQNTSLLYIDRRKTNVAVKFSELNLVERVVVAELLKGELKKCKEALEREAKRVVCLMDNWIQGIENGEPIRVIYRLPIMFKLK